jgi:hypothetical protein
MSFELKQLILDRFGVLDLIELLDIDPEEFYDRFEDIISANLWRLKEVDNGLEIQETSSEET